MTTDADFLAGYLEHAYDPVKAREYYLRTRKLKGRKKADKEFEEMNVKDAQKTLDADLKKTPKIKATRRIGEAEQKLIRARSLANRVQDPAVKAKLLKKLSLAEKKLKAVLASQEPKPKAKPKHTKPDKAGRKPGDPKYGDDPPAKKSVARPVLRKGTSRAS